MTEEFNDWWDKDVLTEDNPFNGGTPAYWAWEGWCAGVKAEREACAMVCEDLPAPERMSLDSESFYECVTLDCADAIRARSNT